MGGVAMWLAAAAVGLAPVPADPPADPTGRGYLGVQIGQDDDAVRVVTVEPGFPAERAGLRTGDEFVQIGDVKPQSPEDLVSYISGCRPGTRLRVEVMRDGEPVVAYIRLATRPAYLDTPLPLELD